MCLYTFHSKPKIAKKDIICYKQVRHELNHAYKYVYTTFYQRMDVTDNIMLGKILSTRDEPEFIYDVDESKYPDIDSLPVFFASIIKPVDFLGLITLHEVNGGFIHTWADNKGLIAVGNICTYKCIIPKDTPYYKGIDGDYASKEIRFVQCINRGQNAGTVKKFIAINP